MRFLIYLFVATLFCVGTVLSTEAALDDNLALYFSFDKDIDGQVYDGTGNGNHGAINLATINADDKKVGLASLEIKDADASVEVESFFDLEVYQDNSFVFWLNFISAHNGAWSQIFAKKAPGSDRSPGVWICPNSLNIHYRFNPGNQGTGCVGPGGEGELFETNKWYHIAGVKESGKFRFFIDGEQIEEHDVPSPHAQGPEKLYIGKTGYRSATFLMDDFFLFTRAISADEVNAIKNGQLIAVEPQDKLTTTWGIIKAKQ